MQTSTQNHLMPVVLRPEVVMVRGQGSFLWDSTGRRYLDFLQGWAVNALGHCAPEVVEMLLSSSRLSTKMLLRLESDLIAVARADLKTVRTELRRFGTAVEHRW